MGRAQNVQTAVAADSPRRGPALAVVAEPGAQPQMSSDEQLRRQRNRAERSVRDLLGDAQDVRVYGAGVTLDGDRAGEVGVTVFARSLDAREVIAQRLRNVANLSDEEWTNAWQPFGRSGSDLIRVYPDTTA